MICNNIMALFLPVCLYVDALITTVLRPSASRHRRRESIRAFAHFGIARSAIKRGERERGDTSYNFPLHFVRKSRPCVTSIQAWILP